VSRLLLLGVVLATGCYTEDAFRADLDAAVCYWQARCDPEVDEEACLDASAEAWEPLPEDCRFHRGKARKCIRLVDELECPRTSDVALPAACDDVWTCD